MFASVEDFNALYDTTYESTDARIVRLLEMASSLIQAEARQRLEHVAGDVAKLLVNDRRVLVLPERPVLDVTAVAVTPLGGIGYPVAVDMLTWTEQGELYGETTLLWPLRSEVQVTYDHGFAVIPDDIMHACCDIVGRMLLNASPTYRPGSPTPTATEAGVAVFSAESRALIRDRYRRWAGTTYLGPPVGVV
jgi:hypothetical protein